GSADVRLVNGASACEGRVEVYHEGQWGTVCDDRWNLDAAAVVCRQLGCGSAVSAPGEAHFGAGSGNIWHLSCRGSEAAVKFCGSPTSANSACGHYEDSGIICSGTGVRLAGGRSLCSGRVEVLRGTSWGTICEADFDMKDAEVVCRQLDCGFPAVLLRGAHFGEGQGLIRTEEIQCRGNETRIHDCPTSTREHQSCTHSNDISLVCTDYSGYRLVGGPDSCSGRVELQYRGEYRTVCDQYWDLRDATVLCQQLGCGEAVAAPEQAWFGQGSGSRGVDVFDCRGNETHLSQCAVSSWGRAACSHGQDAGVICSTQRSLRLVGAGGDCAGRLEVYHNGSWGTVCDDSWDLADSQVVCRQLQCGGTGPIWLDEVGCLGNESSLWECPSAGWGRHDCGHKEDVGVVCSEFKELRLAEGCSGQLEVFYNGTWGNVCWNSMSEDTVSVICQELNCGKSGRVVDSAPRRDSAPHRLDYFNCRPHDSTLWHCPSSAWNQNQCTDSEVALITCSGSTRTTPQTQPLGGLSASPLVLLLLGALFFMVLALLVGQLIQNRKLRKALSKGALAPYHDAVYEEIEYKLAREGTYSAPRRGRFLSDELPSGYDDVEDSEGDPVPEESIPSLKEEIPEYYDDAVTVPQSPGALSGELMSSVKEETPEYYDDAVTIPQSPDALSEYYGDAVTVPQSPDTLSGRLLSDEAPSGYSDVGDSEGDPTSGFLHPGPGVDRVLPTLPSEEGVPAPDRTDYDDVGDESQGEDGCCETDRAVWENLLQQV
ncbi:C163A protein, partial [Atractosteus spatula]|nr:C163A protein [Atractosteus spatula]